MPRPSAPVLTLLSGLTAVTLCAAPAVARHHVTHSHHPAAAKHAARHDKSREPAAPHGATSVPAGGLKIYCARKSPLLVRKMTQGAGTTVTVLCR